MSKVLSLVNLGKNSARVLCQNNTGKNFGSVLPLTSSQTKAYSAYYGEPAEYKESQGNVLLINEENTKWKTIPGNCNIFIN